MDGKEYKIPIDVAFRNEGAAEAQQAIAGTGAAAAGMAHNTAELEKNLTATGNTSELVASKFGGNLRGKMQQTGYQLQDFATQVAGGTSAMTAFGQQAPQLLGAFGPTGAIAGAVVAIGALAYNVFSKANEKTAEFKEDVFDIQKAIDDTVRNNVANLKERFDEGSQAIDRAAQSAASLKQEFKETKKAVNELQAAELDLVGARSEGARLDAKIQGKPTNKLQDAVSSSLEKEARERLAAQQTQRFEADRLKAAQQQAVEEAKLFAQRFLAKQQAESELKLEVEVLETLRDQKREAEEIVRQGKLAWNYSGRPGTSGDKKVVDAQNSKVDNAKEKLANPGFQGTVKAAEGRVGELNKQITDGGSKLNTDLFSSQMALNKTMTGLSDLATATKTEAKKQQVTTAINSTKNVNELKAIGLQSSTEVTQNAKDALQSITDNAAKEKRDLTPLEKDAAERITKILNDSTPDSAQAVQLSGAITALTNNLTAKDAKLTTDLGRCVKLLEDHKKAYELVQNRITALEQKTSK